MQLKQFATFGNALALALAASSVATAVAQQLPVEVFGTAVHLYNAGRFAEAHALFNDAVDRDAEDPRFLYFRGLNLLAMGRDAEAAADFARGAQVEAQSAQWGPAVNRALTRVQGTPRLILERHRAREKQAVRERADKVRQARYESLRLAEDQVLLRPPGFFVDTRSRVLPVAGRLQQVREGAASLVSAEPARSGDAAAGVNPFATAEAGESSESSGSTTKAVSGALGNIFRSLIPQVPKPEDLHIPLPGAEGGGFENPFLPSGGGQEQPPVSPAPPPDDNP